MLPLHSNQSGRYLFQTGFLISFLASLPPGMINMITMRLGLNGEYISACWFALGIMIVEITYANICFALMNQMLKMEFIVKILRWLVLLILTVMAILSFVSSLKEDISVDSTLIGSSVSPFIFGLVMMTINPVQIPFWLGWTTVLLEKKILIPNQPGPVSYLSGIGLGSLMASGVFIVSGQLLFSFVIPEEHSLHFMFGCAFVIMALMQASKLLRATRTRLKT